MVLYIELSIFHTFLFLSLEREGRVPFCGFEFNSFTSTGAGSFKCRSAEPVKIGKCFFCRK